MRWNISGPLLGGIAAILVGDTAAFAQSCPDSPARMVSVQGSVESQRSGAAQWLPASLGEVYCPGDTIRVNARSRADIALANQSVLRLRENTTLELEGVDQDRTYLVELLQGAAHFFSRTGDRNLEVKTPYTVAGVRGTEFYVAVEADQTLVSVFEGRVLASNATGELVLTDGQSAVAKSGVAPALRVVARPRDAVQWAIYYAPVIYDPPSLDAGSESQQMIRESIDAYRKGDLERAFASIDGIADSDIRNADFFTYRASLLLAVGSVEAAQADIDRALSLAANDPDALSLQAVMAVAHNEPKRASELAQRAVASDPRSATARIALSYAQQSEFNLRGARASLENAVELEPENALAWARLAELHSSFGDLTDALAAAQRAATLEPNLARTQTVLGFAHLTQVDTEQAKAAFEKAIQLDQADSLPRLGLGLAKIRDGDLEDGAHEIEIAASLDSNSSVIRSYLGKVYYEQKRSKLDEREYEMAKQLDPRDPTPWFYQAIAKQTSNRPVEALRDNQKAIELNDNRAVYRSSLLLDSDLAARSAALGRIYGDLGFQNLALVEGWKSLNSDPSNFSAHRLLADSYAALPRHEIARVSELLQSQLLQPTNITPIQPRLGEGNLSLVSAQGPSSVSTNEFNPLFNRNGFDVQASGLFGEDDTYSGEGIASAIYDKLSVSSGYSYYDSDGFRDNNDLTDELGTGFAQYEFTPDTSVQAEYRRRKVDNGDVELRFFKDAFSRSRDEKSDSHTARGGFRHRFSPNHTVLASYIYSNKDSRFRDASPFMLPPTLPPFMGPFPLIIPSLTGVNIDLQERSHTGEAQYLFRSDPLDWLNGLIQSINVTSGVGYARVDVDEDLTTELTTQIILPPPFPGLPPIFLPPSPLPPIEQPTRRPDVSHANVYAYSYIALPHGIDLTVGASGDFFDEDDGIDEGGVGEENQGNPKVGITWTPPWSTGTTVRGAAFRTLKRTLVTNQTLEPTQVAGFNQFFDDINGTKAWRYGGAIDQKFTDTLFGGGEFSKRDLKVPFTVVGDSVTKSDWDEYLGRAYLFWTPFDWMSLRAEYQWEKFKRETAPIFAFKRVDTHRVPLGVQFFHPSGLSASFGVTYVDQKGTFDSARGLAVPTLDSGHRDFWILDTALRYRLPKRHGFVTFGVNNLTDEYKTYQATDLNNPDLRPSRFIYGNVTLAFP